jgi:hypothetical protein
MAPTPKALLRFVARHAPSSVAPLNPKLWCCPRPQAFQEAREVAAAEAAAPKPAAPAADAAEVARVLAAKSDYDILKARIFA